MMLTISDLKNIKKAGPKSGWVLLEGERNLRQILTDQLEHEVFFLEGESREGTPISLKHLRSLTSTVSPQPVLVALKLPAQKPFSEGPVLVLDGLSDPGNLGTLLRSARSFGLENILLLTGCVSVYNEKVLRSSLSAVFQLNILEQGHLEDLKGYHIYGADLTGTPFYELKPAGKWALVVGSEAHGIRPQTRPLIDSFVTIPMRGTMESLNAAVAGSILLESFLRESASDGKIMTNVD